MISFEIPVGELHVCFDAAAGTLTVRSSNHAPGHIVQENLLIQRIQHKLQDEGFNASIQVYQWHRHPFRCLRGETYLAIDPNEAESAGDVIHHLLTRMQGTRVGSTSAERFDARSDISRGHEFTVPSETARPSVPKALFACMEPYMFQKNGEPCGNLAFRILLPLLESHAQRKAFIEDLDQFHITNAKNGNMVSSTEFYNQLQSQILGKLPRVVQAARVV